MNIEIDNQTSLDIDVARIEEFMESLEVSGVEVVFVDDEEIQALNATHRGKDKPTDVLSFPLQGVGGFDILGSVVINIDEVIRVSKHLGHSELEEIKILLIHGVLHLQGYNHECDDGEMREKEIELAKRFLLPLPLSDRG
ncbi:MAG: rRNA maturation RNase YbeY [Campylobacterales bacterium]